MVNPSSDSRAPVKIVIPMAGHGRRFRDAGYAFPKPLIDINGQTMIEVVVENLKPARDHRFVFICQKEHYESYDLHNVLKNATGDNFDVIMIDGVTQGAACTVLLAAQYINNDDELVIANSDQFVETGLDGFLDAARDKDADGLIMTFKAHHPKWSYARLDSSGQVVETAEKRVISDNATVGIYYYKRGRDFVEAAQAMIEKGVRHNGEFYVCPAFNEMILAGKRVRVEAIEQRLMHGLGTPEDLTIFLKKLEDQKVRLACAS